MSQDSGKRVIKERMSYTRFCASRSGRSKSSVQVRVMSAAPDNGMSCLGTPADRPQQLLPKSVPSKEGM